MFKFEVMMAKISCIVGNIYPLLNTNVFEVVDQKVAKAAIKQGLALARDFEVKMASQIPKSTHLSFKPKNILSNHVCHVGLGTSQGSKSKLISSSQGPQVAFLYLYNI
jgi:hypothetical protein